MKPRIQKNEPVDYDSTGLFFVPKVVNASSMDMPRETTYIYAYSWMEDGCNTQWFNLRGAGGSTWIYWSVQEEWNGFL